MKCYSVKKLAKLAGISVRTLHLYDQIKLLKPAFRNNAKYRFYGEKELLRLQQILFYKELNFPLKEIVNILDDPDFNLLQALENHKTALKSKQDRISTLLVTIEKTISSLRRDNMLKHEELYEGLLPKEKAKAYRKEAIEKWGPEVKKSEDYLRKMGKEKSTQLFKDFGEHWKKLASMTQEDPTSSKVQQEIALHYTFTRQLWGTTNLSDKQAEPYIGLGELYANDDRYTTIDDQPNPEFGQFMSKTMRHFAETQLK